MFSRRNCASTAVQLTGLAHHAALAEVDLGELATTVLEVEGDRRLGLRPAAPDHGLRELEAVRLHDTDAMRGAGDRVQNWFTPHRNDALDALNWQGQL